MPVHHRRSHSLRRRSHSLRRRGHNLRRRSHDLRRRSHDLRRHSSTRKKRHSSDPAPEYVISKLSAKAFDNRALVSHFRTLCERELAKPRKDQSRYKASRLRQLLMLLTGAEASGDMFVNPTDGKPRDVDAIYRLSAELVKPYRIEGSPGWTGMQRALKFIRKLCNRLTRGRDVAVGALDLYLSYLIANYAVYRPVRAAIYFTRMIGSRKVMDAALLKFKKQISNWNVLQFRKSLAKFAVTVTALFATFVVFGSPHALRIMSLLTTGQFSDRRLYTAVTGLPRSGFQHIRQGFYALMNGASLDEMCLADGIRPEKKVHMRQVAYALTQLDQAVETTSTSHIKDRLGLLQEEKRNSPYMWTDKAKEEKLLNLLERGLDRDHPYSVNKFRRKLMDLAPRTQALHFCTSYGDIRTTTKSIVAAYVLFAHQQWALREKDGGKLLPEVGHPTSIAAAKRAVLAGE